MGSPFDDAARTADALIDVLGGAPEVGVVAGSGWAGLGERLGRPIDSAPYAAIAGVTEPSVDGHPGTAWWRDVEGTTTLLMAGRSHLYEGHGVDAVVHVVRSLVLAGCHTIVLTNAAGSLVPDLAVGDVVLIDDQLNLTGADPLAGPSPPAGRPPRFCDVSELYDPAVRRTVLDADPTVRQGVYAGVRGPSYETPAEVRMLRSFGADLVGMSTVLEAIAAHHLGARVAGVSLVTNRAAGLGPPLAHDDVVVAARDAVDRLAQVSGLLVAAAADRASAAEPTADDRSPRGVWL